MPLTWEDVKEKCRISDVPWCQQSVEAVMEGAVERVCPKMMTVVAIMAVLLLIMWGSGTGSELMSRIVAPIVGGMGSFTVLTLVVISAIYALVKRWWIKRGLEI